ncbi:hypothetical protein FRC06_010141, partial [Ceratobasidium sp. 370]
MKPHRAHYHHRDWQLALTSQQNLRGTLMSKVPAWEARVIPRPVRRVPELVCMERRKADCRHVSETFGRGCCTNEHRERDPLHLGARRMFVLLDVAQGVLAAAVRKASGKGECDYGGVGGIRQAIGMRLRSIHRDEYEAGDK